MSIAIETEPASVADLLAQLGDIPPQRVRMHPAPGTATKADLIKLDARGGKCVELVDGAFVEKAMGFREGLLAMTIASILSSFVKPRDLGVVVGADATVELWSGLVRIPDVAFVSWDRLPDGIPEEAIPELAPNLAIEVLSRSNTQREMERKRSEYFQAGVKLVWIVDANSRTVRVFDSPDTFGELSEAETLDGGEVLPGFSVSVKDIFAELDLKPNS